jgi:hypothetical protein
MIGHIKSNFSTEETIVVSGLNFSLLHLIASVYPILHINFQKSLCVLPHAAISITICDALNFAETEIISGKIFRLKQCTYKRPPDGGHLMRWVGLEPTRLAAHGPQPCLSASSSTSAGAVVL